MKSELEYIKERKQDFPKFNNNYKLLTFSDIKKFKKGDRLKLATFNFHSNKWEKFTFKFEEWNKLKGKRNGDIEIKGNFRLKKVSFDSLGILKNSKFVLFVLSSDMSPVFKV